ncbi:tetraacyldisaccharide 4'-kinase, partial [Dysgonomonas gadei]
PVFKDSALEQPLDILKGKHILLTTGIASPKMILKKLEEYTDKVDTLTYPDHYSFKAKDIQHIVNKFAGIPSENKIILVTEKDATRLILNENIDEEIKMHMYYLPIEVTFLDKEDDFKEKIYKHVRENSGNRRLYKK